MSNFNITPFTIVNAILFQAVWFSCVIGAGANGLDWLAVVAIIILTGAVFFSPHPRSDLYVGLSAVVIGMGLDTLWVYAGILVFDTGTIAPFWIGILWFGLGLTVNHSLSWFRDQRFLGPLIVGCFAPITYLTGQRFGAVVVPDTLLLLPISLSWVGAFFVLAEIALRSLNLGYSDGTDSGAKYDSDPSFN